MENNENLKAKAAVLGCGRSQQSAGHQKKYP